MNISTATTAALETEFDRLEDLDMDQMTAAELRRYDRIAAELEAREAWDHGDARVRESVGNYR